MSSRLETTQPVLEAFAVKQTWKQKSRFLAIAGVGFFADGYLNLTIGLGKFNYCHKPVTPTPFSKS
jgi:hypothetical protein